MWSVGKGCKKVIRAPYAVRSTKVVFRCHALSVFTTKVINDTTSGTSYKGFPYLKSTLKVPYTLIELPDSTLYIDGIARLSA